MFEDVFACGPHDSGDTPEVAILALQLLSLAEPKHAERLAGMRSEQLADVPLHTAED